MSDRQHHLCCVPEDVAPYVLLPGDPARAERIASHFDEAREVARNREYVTFTGTAGGTPVSVTSTGIGCPSTAIAVEELVRLGARTLIRVGTGGALQPDIMPGELIIATAAIRDEGTSRAYVPIEFPAVADPDIVAALSAAAATSGRRWRRGPVHSKDSFYGQKERDRMPIRAELAARYEAWTMAGALLSEMESSALFVVSSYLRVRAGSICAVASNGWKQVRWDESEHSAAIDDVIDCALAAVQKLHASEGAQP